MVLLQALVVLLIRKTTNVRTAAVGDGGNDVAMIQSGMFCLLLGKLKLNRVYESRCTPSLADVGIGIEGKEGKQASLAADFSIQQFSFITKLLC